MRIFFPQICNLCDTGSSFYNALYAWTMWPWHIPQQSSTKGYMIKHKLRSGQKKNARKKLLAPSPHNTLVDSVELFLRFLHFSLEFLDQVKSWIKNYDLDLTMLGRVDLFLTSVQVYYMDYQIWDLYFMNPYILFFIHF